MCAPDTHAVLHRRLSRRSFFAASAASAAAAATLTIRPANAQVGARVVDLTHVTTTDFPGFAPGWGITFENLAQMPGDGFNLRKWTLIEHLGTHLDAPIHFSENGIGPEAIPVEHLMCPLAIIDIAARAAEDADAQVTPDDVAAWEARNGAIPQGACVAMRSGWDAKVGDVNAFRNPDADGGLHFPGFHVEAARMLMERGAVGMAVDTLSLDHGASQTFDTHYAWLPSNRWGLENVANLGALPEAGATIIVGAPKIKGATGGPTRVLALV
jgi:kynurenine formamidase